MATYHRSQRLKLIGSPSVEQLQNGRYRLTFNMKSSNPDEDWYFVNKSRIFADYGTLQSATMSIAGIGPRTGEAYDNMRLVAASSSQSGAGYVITFVYETLSGSFVREVDDAFSEDENGLRVLKRVSIAQAGADYTGSVGTTFIDSQIDSETAVRVYLAGFDMENTDSFRRVTERYVEAGIISITPSSNTQFNAFQSYNIVTVGVPASTIGATNITKPTGGALNANATFFEPTLNNSSGFRTFSQYVIDTNADVSSGDVLLHTYQDYFTVTDPGVMNVNQATHSVTGGTNYTAYALQTVPSSEPQTYRKQGVVTIKLTTSNSVELEVAYSDRTVDFCNVNIASLTTKLTDPVSASWSITNRYFNKYLRGTTATPALTQNSEFEIKDFVSHTGSVAYNTTGVYRSKVTPYERKIDGTQLFLRTTVSFS